MSGPIRLRHNVDMIAAAPPADDFPWGPSSTHVFTSALPKHSIQRRIRPGSSEKHIVAGEDPWAKGWQDHSGDEQDDDPQASSSRSPPHSNERNGRGLSPNAAPKRVFHPLSPSKTNTRRAEENGSSTFVASSRLSRERGNSDGSYETHAKEAAWADFKDGLKDKGKAKMMDEHRDVFVHDVLPTDSLAGVALKYGVELADLRKANKLWASDTIHLRKILYIPVDSQRFPSTTVDSLTSVVEEPLPATSQEDGGMDDPERERRSREASSSSRDALSRPGPPTGTVRRVPASQLAFFPPPTQLPQPVSQPALDIDTPLLSGYPRSSPRPTLSRLNSSDGTGLPSFSAFTSSAVSSSLRGIPSLFAAFPVLTPSRVSFSSEGTSDRSVDDIEVELDETTKWRKYETVSNGHAPAPASKGMGGTTRRKAPKGKLSEIDWGTYASAASAGSIATIRSSPRHAPTLWPLLPSTPVIRNQQPTPSPLMELPRRMAKPS